MVNVSARNYKLTIGGVDLTKCLLSVDGWNTSPIDIGSSILTKTSASITLLPVEGVNVFCSGGNIMSRGVDL